mgnify:CR=1 FL=1
MIENSQLFLELNEVEKYIFSYDINEAFSKLASVVDSLHAVTQRENNKETEKINTVFQKINEAIEKKDFLLVADLIEYQLKPTLKTSLASMS